MTDQPYEVARRGYPTIDQPPAPPTGDEFTNARIIINSARLVLPPGMPSPRLTMTDTAEDRRTLAAFLREHGVPTPDFVPVVYGWLDCYTGLLANPAHEPGANGRRFS